MKEEKNKKAIEEYCQVITLRHQFHVRIVLIIECVFFFSFLCHLGDIINLNNQIWRKKIRRSTEFHEFAVEPIFSAMPT